jgi:alpha-tubulin suppressor-like RCC1 family protein
LGESSPFSDDDYLRRPKLPHLHSIVRGIYNGFKHTLLVTKDNEIVVFGSNYYGQYEIILFTNFRLGVIPEEKQENLLPVKLALKIASKDLKIKAAGGFEHTIIYTGNDSC